MSASISCKQVLERLQRGESVPADVIRQLGEKQPGDFFRIIIESLADSFDPAQAAAYEELMRAWIPPVARISPVIPRRVDTVYVLSRVTLGADIKITSAILDAMKRRFPEARIVLISNRKSAELFAANTRIEHLEAAYPRSGPVSARLEFARQLRQELQMPNRIVIDPDSRITQLGLVPVCEPEYAFHFPSRAGGGNGNLTEMIADWLDRNFDVAGEAWLAPEFVTAPGDAPRAAVSFGVGENASKRFDDDFETNVIRSLGEKYSMLWLDRGVGGEEAERVTKAAIASGLSERVRFWEGSFAGFASILSQCDLYVGYDSAGQHAAAAAGIPLITFFRGAVSERFRQRWSPAGRGRIDVIDADSLTPEACLDRFRALLELPRT